MNKWTKTVPTPQATLPLSNRPIQKSIGAMVTKNWMSQSKLSKHIQQRVLALAYCIENRRLCSSAKMLASIYEHRQINNKYRYDMTLTEATCTLNIKSILKAVQPTAGQANGVECYIIWCSLAISLINIIGSLGIDHKSTLTCFNRLK